MSATAGGHTCGGVVRTSKAHISSSTMQDEAGRRAMQQLDSHVALHQPLIKDAAQLCRSTSGNAGSNQPHAADTPTNMLSCNVLRACHTPCHALPGDLPCFSKLSCALCGIPWRLVTIAVVLVLGAFLPTTTGATSASQPLELQEYPPGATWLLPWAHAQQLRGALPGQQQQHMKTAGQQQRYQLQQLRNAEQRQQAGGQEDQWEVGIAHRDNGPVSPSTNGRIVSRWHHHADAAGSVANTGEFHVHEKGSHVSEKGSHVTNSGTGCLMHHEAARHYQSQHHAHGGLQHVVPRVHGAGGRVVPPSNLKNLHQAAHMPLLARHACRNGTQWSGTHTHGYNASNSSSGTEAAAGGVVGSTGQPMHSAAAGPASAAQPAVLKLKSSSNDPGQTRKASTAERFPKLAIEDAVAALLQQVAGVQDGQTQDDGAAALNGGFDSALLQAMHHAGDLTLRRKASRKLMQDQAAGPQAGAVVIPGITLQPPGDMWADGFLQQRLLAFFAWAHSISSTPSEADTAAPSSACRIRVACLRRYCMWWTLCGGPSGTLEGPLGSSSSSEPFRVTALAVLPRTADAANYLPEISLSGMDGWVPRMGPMGPMGPLAGSATPAITIVAPQVASNNSNEWVPLNGSSIGRPPSSSLQNGTAPSSGWAGRNSNSSSSSGNNSTGSSSSGNSSGGGDSGSSSAAAADGVVAAQVERTVVIPGGASTAAAGLGRKLLLLSTSNSTNAPANRSAGTTAMVPPGSVSAAVGRSSNASTGTPVLATEDEYSLALDGSITTAVASLSNLTVLHISGVLSGVLPDFWGSALPQLMYLNLSSNVALKSVIPASWGKLTALKYLDLSGNELMGLVPASFRALQNLTYIDLSNNSLCSLDGGGLQRLTGADRVITGPQRGCVGVQQGPTDYIGNSSSASQQVPVTTAPAPPGPTTQQRPLYLPPIIGVSTAVVCLFILLALMFGCRALPWPRSRRQPAGAHPTDAPEGSSMNGLHHVGLEGSLEGPHDAQSLPSTHWVLAHKLTRVVVQPDGQHICLAREVELAEPSSGSLVLVEATGNMDEHRGNMEEDNGNLDEHRGNMEEDNGNTDNNMGIHDGCEGQLHNADGSVVDNHNGMAVCMGIRTQERGNVEREQLNMEHDNGQHVH